MEQTSPRWRCGCIDIHTHVVPRDFPAYLGSRIGVPWPSMAQAQQPCHRHVMISGKVYRTVPDQSWDTALRRDDMDRIEVERHVLSPMPELLSYWLDAEDGAVLSRYLNETLAQMVADAPSRFSALGAVPLQDVDLAIKELDYAMHVLKLSGVEIGSNVNGTAIGDPRFEPFFAAAEEWGAALFVHPLRPAGMDRLVGPRSLEQVVGFPGEIGLAAASLITGGTLARHPRLRIAMSHGGGSIQALVPRLQYAWEATQGLRDAIQLAPNSAARLMFYDDLLYDAAAIRALIELVGAGQVMVGTDYPFAIMDREPAQRLLSLNLDDEAAEMLRWRNAARWLAFDLG
ncbi:MULTISPECIES: amidohydrolase family protein [unclassified Variovorax]|uniref:amidohydrolase family protein n=1 Tax=unclassified Variovorax TaxID=663243 RepID=UPI001BD51485|nr:MULTISPECIES: amidohydrolase family protein [unclassified Variovorax]